MSRRKKKEEEHENLERWLVSYADFMTLLFAFFVVMYSISSVNEGKYRVLSDSLSGSFSKDPASPEVIDFENPKRQVELSKSNELIELPIPNDEKAILFETKNPTLNQVEKEVTNAVQDFVNKGLITITNNDNWLEIEIKSNILFNIGGARLSDKAEDILAGLAQIIRTYPNQIQVEGYTDNIPINTSNFPSNWELSSSRAASVVHLFEDEGVNPNNMQAIGFGQYKPKSSNDTAQGRSDNRRVVLVVLGSSNTRKKVKSNPSNNSTIKDIESDPEKYNAEPSPLIKF